MDAAAAEATGLTICHGVIKQISCRRLLEAGLSSFTKSVGKQPPAHQKILVTLFNSLFEERDRVFMAYNQLPSSINGHSFVDFDT
jgi:hypothetical protein